MVTRSTIINNRFLICKTNQNVCEFNFVILKEILPKSQLTSSNKLMFILLRLTAINSRSLFSLIKVVNINNRSRICRLNQNAYEVKFAIIKEVHLLSYLTLNNRLTFISLKLTVTNSKYPFLPAKAININSKFRIYKVSQNDYEVNFEIVKEILQIILTRFQASSNK